MPSGSVELPKGWWGSADRGRDFHSGLDSPGNGSIVGEGIPSPSSRDSHVIPRRDRDASSQRPPVTSPTDDYVREQLAGRYDLQGEVGRGGMGVIYRARALDGADVAVKILRPEIAASIGGERFRREIALTSDLRHPRLVPLLDSGVISHPSGVETPFYTMPFVPGESLRARLDREGQLPVEDALRITREVGEALVYAHDHGVIHRDIKPENILLAGDGARLLDFGIARAITQASGTRLTESGTIIGTPAYMSPEQASGGQRLDARSDIYSLGCVLYEMLAGEPPFSGTNTQAIVARHMAEPPPPLQVIRPRLPYGIVTQIERALAKVPADRYPSVSAFLEDLGSEVVSPAVRIRRRRMAVAAVVLIAGLLWLRFVLAPTQPLMDNQVLVFPLASTGVASRDEGWDAAIAIEQALEHTEPLRWVDGWRELDVPTRSDPSRLEADQARRFARKARARFFIEGTVRHNADSLTVSLRLFDVAGDTLVAQESASGPPTENPAAPALAAVGPLLVHLIEPGRRIDLRALTERRLGALALWLQGERAYRQSHFPQALDLYRRSVETDSLMAIAAVKGAQAASWESRFDDAGELIRAALRAESAAALRAQSALPRRYATLARGLGAYFDGRADTAVKQLRDVIAAEPTWAEAAMAVGEVYYHLLPHEARPDSVAEDWFRRAAALDSAFSPPRIHLAEVLLRRGSLTEAARWMGQAEALGGTTNHLARLRLMSLCVQGRLNEAGWGAHTTGDDREAAFLAAKELSGGAGQAPCAVHGMRAILAHAGDSAGYAWGAFLTLHGLLLSAGDTAGAARLVDSLAVAGTNRALAFNVLDLLAGAPRMAEATVLAGKLVERGGPGYAGVGPDARWLMSIYHLLRGEEASVRAIAEGFAHAVARGCTRQDSLLAAITAGHLALVRGDTTGAIRRFDALRPTARRDGLLWELTEPLSVEYLLLARLRLARGQPDEALKAAAIFDHPQPVLFLSFLGESLRLRLEAANAMGRSREAEEYRRRLAGLATIRSKGR